MAIPIPEFPRPQLQRDTWMNLNGVWEFEFYPGQSGKERGVLAKERLDREILVPFCPESSLSGIGDTDFHPAVWYRRSFELTDGQLSGRVLLHFQAVDYASEIWVNGEPAGSHLGGYSSFALDVTRLVRPGMNTLTVYATDSTFRDPLPRGKQSDRYSGYGCSYTRTTGIWQTVWLEFVPQTYIGRLRLIPSAAASSVSVEAVLEGDAAGCALHAEAFYQGRKVGCASVLCAGKTANVCIPLSETHLWAVGKPELYDLTVTLTGSSEDCVQSYFGLRDIVLRDGCTWINGEPVFQRLVLDQGFNPEGIYTAPTDEFLKRDIELSMSLGFNGARFHQRVFEERSYYWADKLGYLVWGEFPSWGLDIESPNGIKYFVREWTEVVQRDWNHPSLIGWCPFNETWSGIQDPTVVPTAFDLTRALDPTRIVIDSSGGNHFETDMYDVHDYEQDPEMFRVNYAKLDEGLGFEGHVSGGKWKGEPYWVSEYGGTWWNPGATGDSWGYGNRPRSEEEVIERYVGLTRVLLEHPKICGFCYTQLTDVEQEQNGLLYYDRTPKFTEENYRRIRDVNMTTAAMEAKK